VGIFNGLFQVTAVTQGIDQFINIVSALVLLISETQVQKYQLNNEERAAARTPAGSSNVEVQSIGLALLAPTPKRGDDEGGQPRSLITRGTPSSYF
jgi:hypothetical protein